MIPGVILPTAPGLMVSALCFPGRGELVGPDCGGPGGGRQANSGSGVQPGFLPQHRGPPQTLKFFTTGLASVFFVSLAVPLY